MSTGKWKTLWNLLYKILFDTLKHMYISCFTVSFILIPWVLQQKESWVLKCCVKTKCSKWTMTFRSLHPFWMWMMFINIQVSFFPGSCMMLPSTLIQKTLIWKFITWSVQNDKDKINEPWHQGYSIISGHDCYSFLSTRCCDDDTMGTLIKRIFI